MDNRMMRRYLMHKATSLAATPWKDPRAKSNDFSSASASTSSYVKDTKPKEKKESDIDWNNPEDSAFSNWKHDYNVNYYSEHKDQWLVYNDPSRKGSSADLEKMIKEGAQRLIDNPEQARAAINSAATFLEANKEEIASKSLDALELGMNQAVEIGKAILKEAKKRYIEDWSIGVDTIKNKAKQAKSSFQNSFNSGMDTIVSGLKSFASAWKAGW